MSTPDPGWYPDPDDESRLRYWDGSGWTDRTGEREAIAQGPPPPPPPGSDSGSRPPWRHPLTVAGALALIVAIAVVVVLTRTGEAGAEVILEPVAATGQDPFTESVASDEVAELTSNGAELAGEPVEGISGGSESVESIAGAAPGLYGGTGEEAVCDPEAMIAFLEENPDKAAAFAEAVGVSPDELSEYIGGLTPVILREDTRVTNHGFMSGAANPFQAVLQAGSAVMVDDRGVPRVRCECGNPLAEPAAAETPEFAGERWVSFDEGRLVAVSPAEEQIESFELVDVRTGETYEQAAGSGGGDPRDLIFDFGGVGSLRIGMTEREAEEATDLDVEFSQFNPSFECSTFSVAGIDSLGGLASDGKHIGSVGSSDRGARTTEGVGIGSTFEEIEDAYPGQTRREPVPVNPALEQLVVEDGEGNAFVFGSDEGGTIDYMRVGTEPDIFAPEGCV